MLKLICSDVDGTLVPDGGHELNPEYFSQIRRLKKAGCSPLSSTTFCSSVTTGRVPSTAAGF